MKRLIFILSLVVSTAAFAKTAIEDEVVPFPTTARPAKTRSQVYQERCPGVNIEPVEAGNLSACKAADDSDNPQSETEAYVLYVTGPRKSVAAGSNVQVTGLSDNTLSPPAALRPAAPSNGDRPDDRSGHQ